MLNLREADSTQTRFYQEVLQIGQRKGRKAGRIIGRQEGRQEGRQKTIDLMLRQLNRRCGQLSIAQQAQIKSLPIADIENLAEALLDFKGMDDLELWLKY